MGRLAEGAVRRKRGARWAPFDSLIRLLTCRSRGGAVLACMVGAAHLNVAAWSGMLVAPVKVAPFVSCGVSVIVVLVASLMSVLPVVSTVMTPAL